MTRRNGARDSLLCIVTAKRKREKENIEWLK